MSNITWHIPGYIPPLEEFDFLEEEIGHMRLSDPSLTVIRRRSSSEIYVMGTPQQVGRVFGRQELAVLPADTSNENSGGQIPYPLNVLPSGPQPLRGLTADMVYIDDRITFHDISWVADPEPGNTVIDEPMPEERAFREPYVGEPYVGEPYTTGTSGFSGRNNVTWSKDYKRNNKHLYQRRRKK